MPDSGDPDDFSPWLFPYSFALRYSIRADKLFTRSEIDEFVALYERKDTNEAEIQAYLAQHPKFLLALGAYQQLRAQTSFASTITGKDGKHIELRPDFVLQDPNGFWDIVEIKQASFDPQSLIVGTPQRRRFAASLNEGLAQLETYLRELEHEAPKQSLQEKGIVVDRPQGWLIVGRNNCLPREERRVLEERLPRRVRLVTYDEVRDLAHERLVVVTPTIVMPPRWGDRKPRARFDEAEGVLFSLAEAVELRDRYAQNHCERLVHYSTALGLALGLPQQDLMALYRGSYLHDIGKVSIPDTVLFKAGRLTAQEWEIMRRHTTAGVEICGRIKSLAPVLPIIRSHHEHWDGSGYPDGLAKEGIPLLARVLQIADIYDALTSARFYRPAMSSVKAVATLQDDASRGWTDPELTRVFMQCARMFRTGGV